MRARTANLLRARQALSQLSYSPKIINNTATNYKSFTTLVGLSGFEPLTSRLSGVRSNQLSYRPRIPCKILEHESKKVQEQYQPNLMRVNLKQYCSLDVNSLERR